MHGDYYQNILYPLQDRVLSIVAEQQVDFFLTGGTPLGRVYLGYRYSDDLDFFVNHVTNFKQQVSAVLTALQTAGFATDVPIADDSYARAFIDDGAARLKIDFVNDVPFRSGEVVSTSLFPRTDNLPNILSNKLTALSRYAAKDLVDIIYICRKINFNWEQLFLDAAEKDMWVNPVNVAEILSQFPGEKLREIIWINEPPTATWIQAQLDLIIPEMLEGADNTLCPNEN